jgi:hypothetical protein
MSESTVSGACRRRLGCGCRTWKTGAHHVVPSFTFAPLTSISWWKAKLKDDAGGTDGAVGLIPATYVEEVSGCACRPPPPLQREDPAERFPKDEVVGPL